MKLSLTPVVALLALASAGCSLIGGNAVTGNQVGAGQFGAQGARPVGYIYTTLYGKNAIMEINNTQSRANPDPILVPNGPRSIAVDPRGTQQYLYVVCELADSVAVVDRRSRQVVRSINVGRRPYAIALTPNGLRAFVTNSDDDTVSVIDTTSNTVVNTVQLVPPTTAQPVGATGAVTQQAVRMNPKGVASNGDGSHVYVACAGGYMVELDGQTGTLNSQTGTTAGGQQYTATRNIPLTGAVAPLNVAVGYDAVTTTATQGQPAAPTADNVYISDPQGNKIFYIAANATQANPVQSSGAPWGLAVHHTAAGKADKLFVTQSTLNAVATYSLPDLGSGQGANVEGHNPQAIAASPVGDEVYVSVTGDNSVAVMTVNSNGTLSRPSYFQTNTLNQEFVTATGDIALGGFLF